MPTKKTTKTVKSPTRTSLSASDTKMFPSILEGIRKAIEMIPKVALPSIGVTVIMYLAMLVIFAILGGGFLVANVGSLQVLSQASDVTNPQAIATLLASGGVALVLAILASAVVGTVYSIVQTKLYLSVYRNETPQIGEAIRESWPLVLPLILVSLVTGFLTLGGGLLFLIPGLIIGILVGFASFTIIVDGFRGLDAIKESVRLVSGSFWQLALRVVVVGVILLLINGVLEDAFSQMGFVVLIFNIAQTLFVTAYGLVLYEQTKAVTLHSPRPSITWMFVVAMLGILLAGLTAGAIIKAVKASPRLQEILQQVGDSNWEGMNEDGTYLMDTQELEDWNTLEGQLPPEVLNSPEFQETQDKLRLLLESDREAAEQEKKQNALYAD